MSSESAQATALSESVVVVGPPTPTLLPQPFNYHSHSRQPTLTTTGPLITPTATDSATSSSSSTELSQSVRLLTAGETFERYSIENHMTSTTGAHHPHTILLPQTIHIFLAPLLPEQTYPCPMALWWNGLGSEPNQRNPAHCLPMDQILDVFKGATSEPLIQAVKEAATAAATASSSATLIVPHVRDEECLVLHSANQTLSLQAPNQQIRDAWIKAICTFLELDLHKVRHWVEPERKKEVDHATSSAPVVPAPAEAAAANGIHETNPVTTASTTSTTTTTTTDHPPSSTALPNLIRTPSFSTVQPTAEQSAKLLKEVEQLATEKAQLVHDIQLTLTQMIKDSSELIRHKYRNQADRPDPKEFDEIIKLKSKNFTHIKVSSAERFESKAYAPTIFTRLRHWYGITDEAFLASVADPEKGYNDLIVNSKSGSFFFYSHDNQYLLKSCTIEENKILIQHMLKNYYQHLHQYPDSLLIKLLGSFRLEITKPHKQTLHFFIMKNVFASPPQKPIHVRFDLKGSTYGRQAKETELAQEVPVLKDLDFFNGVTFPDGRSLPPTFLHLGHKKSAILKQMSLDADYLRRNEIMDYSLLVGIHYERMMTTTDVKSSDQSVAPGLDRPSTTTTNTSQSNLGTVGLNNEQQTNYGLKPQKEVLIPRQLLRRATIALLAEEERKVLQQIANGETTSVSPAATAASSSSAAPISPTLPQLTTRPPSKIFEPDGSLISSSEDDDPDDSHDGTEIYYLGVIDILQRYTTFKKFEKTIKGLTLSPEAVSCADPYFYYHRFIRRLSTHFLGDGRETDQESSESEDENDRSHRPYHMTAIATPPPSHALTQPSSQQHSNGDELRVMTNTA